jgi:hypothetical protein
MNKVCHIERIPDSEAAEDGDLYPDSAALLNRPVVAGRAVLSSSRPEGQILDL